MNQNLFLMRHAKAAFNQHLDPLGVSEQKKMALALKEKGVFFDLLLYSPIPRARQSAEIILREYPQVLARQETLLGEAFDSEELLKVLQKLEVQNIFLVGHEPSLVFLIHRFLEKPMSFELKTSSVVQLQFEKTLQWNKAKWVSFFSPRDL